MALPSKFKKNINIGKSPQNRNYPEDVYMKSGAANDMKDMITDKNAYFPKGILHEDLDAGFKEFIKNLSINFDGVEVPVIMMGLQKWNELATTWQYSDKYKNIKIPFINIIRKPNARPGSNPSLRYNIPQGKNYEYARVPTFDGINKGFDLYMIPQPIPIDIDYEVKLFTYRQEEINTMNKIILKKFQSRQAYTLVNGHHIPIIMEDNTDDSNLSNIDSKRYYEQTYSFMLQGFILDPKDFEIVPTINKTFIMLEKKQ